MLCWILLLYTLCHYRMIAKILSFHWLWCFLTTNLNILPRGFSRHTGFFTLGDVDTEQYNNSHQSYQPVKMSPVQTKHASFFWVSHVSVNGICFFLPEI